MRMNTGINWTGNVTIGTGGARIVRVQATATISGNISGGNLEAGVGTSDTLILLGNNTYGNTIVFNGNLQIGNNNTQGTLGTGSSIVLANSGVLQYDRTDSLTFNQTISGGSSTSFRIRRGASVTFDGNSVAVGTLGIQNGTLNFANSPTVTVAGVVDIGDETLSNNSAGAAVTGTLNMSNGVLTANSMDLGNQSLTSAQANGIVNQSGGTITLIAAGAPQDGGGLRLGLWSAGTGVYNMSGGNLTIGNNQAIDLSINGTGFWNQTGGTVSAFSVNLATRGDFGESTFNINGGLFNLGTGGFTKGLSNSPSMVNLGGGTLRAAGDFSFPFAANLTGINGPAVIDTNGYSVTASGILSGAGGITKAGARHSHAHRATTPTPGPRP